MRINQFVSLKSYLINKYICPTLLRGKERKTETLIPISIQIRLEKLMLTVRYPSVDRIEI